MPQGPHCGSDHCVCVHMMCRGPGHWSAGPRYYQSPAPAPATHWGHSGASSNRSTPAIQLTQPSDNRGKPEISSEVKDKMLVEKVDDNDLKEERTTGLGKILKATQQLN